MRLRNAGTSPEYPAAGTPGADDDCATADEVISRHSRTIGVALVGNPNSGKTSLFNAISGGHEHVGNYSGVTVGAKSGHRYYRGYRFEVTDLPGTYALSAYTPEERYVRSHIAEKDARRHHQLGRGVEPRTQPLPDDRADRYKPAHGGGSQYVRRARLTRFGARLRQPGTDARRTDGTRRGTQRQRHRSAVGHRDRRVREPGRARTPHPHKHGPRHRRGAPAAQGRYERLPRRTAQGLPAALLRHEDARRRQAGRGTAARQQPLPRVGGDPRPRGQTHRRSPGRGCRDGFRQPEIRVHSGGAQGDLHPGETRRGLGHEADRHLRDAQAVGLPDLFFPDVADVLVHIQPRRLPAGVDRHARGMDRQRRGRAAARGRCATSWSTASSAAWGRSSSSCPTS